MTFRRYLFLFILVTGSLSAEEVINDIVAVVGDVPITYIDLKEELNKPDSTRSVDRRNRESQALDKLIENAIIDAVLKEEVISIPESQIEEIVKRNMQENGFTDEKKFESVLQQQMHLSLDEYKREILNNLKIQQISQLKITTPQPSDYELKTWYNVHRKEIGNKYLLRIIKRKFNPSNAKDELAVNQLMNKARNEAMVNFADTARKYSDDASASNGGSLGWFRIDELNARDPIIANIVYRLQSGEVSMVFVSHNNYYLLKVDSMMPISFEDAAPMIMQKIYRDKQSAAFADWLKTKRKSSAVIILLKGYQELR